MLLGFAALSGSYLLEHHVACIGEVDTGLNGVRALWFALLVSMTALSLLSLAWARFAIGRAQIFDGAHFVTLVAVTANLVVEPSLYIGRYLEQHAGRDVPAARLIT